MTLIEKHGSPEHVQELLKLGKKVLNVDSHVLLIQKQQDFVEFFSFSGNHQTSCLEKIYLNNAQLLASFADHFKNQLNPVFLKMAEESCPLQNLKGGDHFNFKSKC